MREYVVENEFIKAVKAAGGVAYKLNSLTANGLPDRLVLFFPAKTVFVELKAPGKQMRPLQRKLTRSAKMPWSRAEITQAVVEIRSGKMRYL